MWKSLLHWSKRNAYGQFTSRVFLALGAAAVSIGLSYLPYDTILQAIWVAVSSLFMGYIALRQRLNETDDARYQRLSRTQFEHLERAEPEALNTIFAQNLRPPVFGWFAEDYGVELSRVKQIDALDSLARSADRPGQLIFRAGVQLGQWLQEGKSAADSRQFFEGKVAAFIDDHKEWLGEELSPGVFYRLLKKGEHRPVGIHMFHPASRCLLTVEKYDRQMGQHSVALSFKSHLCNSMSEEEWQSFRTRVHQAFPIFQPAKGGSGPQKKTIPFFISAAQNDWTTDKPALAQSLKALLELLTVEEKIEESEAVEPE